jgi:glycosyltransferase involved in cell wall biosynthesis
MQKPKSIISLASCPFRQQPVLRKEARTLVKFGWQVQIIAWDRRNLFPALDTVDGIAVENILIRGTYGTGGVDLIFKTLLFWCFAFGRLVKKRASYSIIHCQDLNTILPAWFAARLLCKSIVFDSHDPYPEMLSLTQPAMVVALARYVERFFCRRVDAVLTVNRLMQERFRRMTRKPIYIVYNYPELEFFKAEPKQSSGPVVIGRIGTMAEELGIEETILAFRKVAHEFDVRLLFVGRLAESLAERYQELIKPVRDMVQHIDDIPYFQVPEYYRQMDISMVLYGKRGISPFVSPMKLFESMAMGVAVVASDVGEVRALVEKTNCGLIVPCGDDEAAARALRTLLGDAKLRQHMGRNGLAMAEAEQNWESEGQKLIRMYEDLLDMN